MTVRPRLPAGEWEGLLAKNTATEDLESWRKTRRPESAWDPLVVIIIVCFGIAIFYGAEIANLV